MTGYVRKDTSNNIADGNIINAADLDAEFDGVQDAFNSSTGHKHDGTSGEGAPITVVGPVQDVVISAIAVTPKTTNTVDIGSSSLKFKDIYITGTATLPTVSATTIGATTGNITTVNATTVDTTNIEVTNIKAKDGTASATIADSTGVVTVASAVLTTADINGGTLDNVVIGGSTAAAASVTTLTTSSTVTHNAGTANGVAYLNGSKVLTTGGTLTFDGFNLTVGGQVLSGRTGTAGTYALARSSDGLGTAVLESLAGTNNIGLRNTVGSLIFSANNAEGMRLTSTGLGIGTSSPAASCRLEVAGTNSTTLVRNSTTTAANGFNAFSTGGNFYFGIDSSAGNFYNAGAYGRAIYSDGAYPIAFYTNATERMRLDASGNLGLGVTPSAWGSLGSSRAIQLARGALSSFSGGPNDYIAVSTNSFADTSSDPASAVWKYVANGAATLYEGGRSGTHRWYTAPSGTAGATISFTQAMTLNASGNLGIGTTSPTTRVHTSIDSATIGADFQTTGSATESLIQFRDPATTNFSVRIGSNGNNMRFYAGGATRATLDSSGNLGLGVTATNVAGNRKLEVGGTTNSAVVLSTNSSNAAARNWATAANFNAFGDYVFLQSNALGGDPVSAGTTRMMLDSSGNLGIGTTTIGGSANDRQVTVSGSSSAQASFTSNGVVTNSAGANTTLGYIGTTTNHPFIFTTNNTERMRLDASGNLGLGVTPSAWDSSILTAMQVRSASISSVPSFANDSYFSSNAFFNAGWKYISTSSATQYRQANGVHSWSTAPSGTAGNAISFTQAMTLDASGNLAIGTTSAGGRLTVLQANSQLDIGTNSTRVYLEALDRANLGNSINFEYYARNGAHIWYNGTYTERARIDSSGNLLVATTTASTTDTSNGTVLSSTGGYIISRRVSGASQTHLQFVNGGTTVGNISSSTTTTTYATSSDQRLKENIADADDASALIDAIQVRKYDWKSDGSHQRYGFIAQELVTVAPEAVHQPADPEEMMAVDYSKLVPMLVKEIQSLRKRLADAGIA